MRSTSRSASATSYARGGPTRRTGRSPGRRCRPANARSRWTSWSGSASPHSTPCSPSVLLRDATGHAEARLVVERLALAGQDGLLAARVAGGAVDQGHRDGADLATVEAHPRAAVTGAVEVDEPHLALAVAQVDHHDGRGRRALDRPGHRDRE